jgi:hypothetical protein
VFRASLSLCGASLLVTAYLAHQYVDGRAGMIEQAKARVRDHAVEAANEIDGKFSRLKTVVVSLATDLNSGEIDDEKLIERLQSAMVEHPHLYQFGVAYAPFAHAPEERLFGPYYSTIEGPPQLYHLAYDYTEPKHQWYHRPLERGEEWAEPYFGEAAGTFLAEYGASFQRPASGGGNAPAGVIYANYALDDVRKRVGRIDLGGTGYGFIVTRQGTVVSHPIRSYLGRKISDLGDDGLIAMTASTDHEELVPYSDKTTGQTHLIMYRNLSSTDWIMGFVFDQKHVISDSASFRRRQVAIVVSTILFLFFLSVVLSGAYAGKPQRIWSVALFGSVLCLAGICFVLHQAVTAEADSNAAGIAVFDRVGVEAAFERFLAGNPDLARACLEDPPIEVPTGVFVQSIRFSSANNVVLTGYIWQKLRPGSSGEIVSGIVFPEAETIDMQEAYKVGEVTGWYFAATLRQQFDYSKYPFDREDVWIRLWHKEFHRNIFLVPDFAAYEHTNPSFLPGLEADFVLEGWELLQLPRQQLQHRFWHRRIRWTEGFPGTLLQRVGGQAFRQRLHFRSSCAGGCGLPGVRGAVNFDHCCPR